MGSKCSSTLEGDWDEGRACPHYDSRAGWGHKKHSNCPDPFGSHNKIGFIFRHLALKIMPCDYFPKPLLPLQLYLHKVYVLCHTDPNGSWQLLAFACIVSWWGYPLSCLPSSPKRKGKRKGKRQRTKENKQPGPSLPSSSASSPAPEAVWLVGRLLLHSPYDAVGEAATSTIWWPAWPPRPRSDGTRAVACPFGDGPKPPPC